MGKRHFFIYEKEHPSVKKENAKIKKNLYKGASIVGIVCRITNDDFLRLRLSKVANSRNHLEELVRKWEINYTHYKKLLKNQR